MQQQSEPVNYQLLYEQSQAQNAQLQYAVASLSHQLEQLKKMIFGSKGERFVAAADNTTNPQQLTLSLDAQTLTTCNITAVTKVQYLRTKTKIRDHTAKLHPGRMKLPEHLRRETILLQIGSKMY